MKTRVKVFEATDASVLESQMNDWFSEKERAWADIEIHYSTCAPEYGDDGTEFVFSALVRYKGT